MGKDGMEKQRIWELDALRGLCICGMVSVHFCINAGWMGVLPAPASWLFQAVRIGGGLIFIALSGLCSTLGHHPVRRGLIVLGGVMLITLVTGLLCALDLAAPQLFIPFGILHLLGTAMLLTPLLDRLPSRALALCALCLLAAGYWCNQIPVRAPYLFPLGLAAPSFASVDWFPLLPNLGWYGLGMCLGRALNPTPRTRLPVCWQTAAPVRFFCLCGRHSLAIYLLHQPLLYGLLLLLQKL